MPLLYLVEVPEDPDERCNTESSFIHSHNLDLEGIIVWRLPDGSIDDAHEEITGDRTAGEQHTGS